MRRACPGLLAALLVLVSLTGLASPASATAVFAGALSLADPVFNRPVSGSTALGCTLSFLTGAAVRYHAYTVLLAGETDIQVTLGTLPDSFIALYQGSFDPAAPCTNLVAANDNANLFGLASRLAGVVIPGTYVVVVTTSTGGLGTYTLHVTNDVPAIITGAGPGGSPEVRGFTAQGGSALVDFLAYPPAFTGGVHVAAGRLTAGGGFGVDTAKQIITGAGAGGAAHVRAFHRDGSDFGVSFDAYPGFTGGVRVAVCQALLLGLNLIVTAPGPGGGPHVRVWQIGFVTRAATLVAEFMAYDPGYTGGVILGCGNVDPATPVPRILTGTDFGGGAHVRVWALSGAAPPYTVTEIFSPGFLVYPPGFTGGVRVAAADVDGDSRAEIVAAAGPGGGPHVRAFKTAMQNPTPPPQFLPLSPPLDIVNFMAYDVGFTGGVFVAAGLGGSDEEIPPKARIVTAPGAGGGPNVRVFDVSSFGSPVELASFFAYPPTFLGGVEVTTGR